MKIFLALRFEDDIRGSRRKEDYDAAFYEVDQMEMTGSYKQKKWAREIIKGQIELAIHTGFVSQFFETFKRHPEASYWIENRDKGCVEGMPDSYRVD